MGILIKDGQTYETLEEKAKLAVELIPNIQLAQKGDIVIVKEKEKDVKFNYIGKNSKGLIILEDKNGETCFCGLNHFNDLYKFEDEITIGIRFLKSINQI